MEETEEEYQARANRYVFAMLSGTKDETKNPVQSSRNMSQNSSTSQQTEPRNLYNTSSNTSAVTHNSSGQNRSLEQCRSASNTPILSEGEVITENAAFLLNSMRRKRMEIANEYDQNANKTKPTPTTSIRSLPPSTRPPSVQAQRQEMVQPPQRPDSPRQESTSFRLPPRSSFNTTSTSLPPASHRNTRRNATVADESTWLEESDARESFRVPPRQSTFGYRSDPHEPILASSGQSPNTSTRNESGFPRMFPDLANLSINPPSTSRNSELAAPPTVIRQPANREMVQKREEERRPAPIAPQNGRSFDRGEIPLIIRTVTSKRNTAPNPTRPPRRIDSTQEIPIIQTEMPRREPVPSKAMQQVFQNFDELPELPAANESFDEWVPGKMDALLRSIEPTPPLQPCLIRKEGDIPAEQLERNKAVLEQQELLSSKILQLTGEKLCAMSITEQREVLDALGFGYPSEKFKINYPFMVEGVVQKDSQMQQLKVFTARLGRVYIPDSPERMDKDYVYFLVAKEGVYCGFTFAPHPRNLISAKFPSHDRIVIRGYAIMAHPPDRMTKSEARWVCWNDQMGMMQVSPGSARISLKKQPVWDKQLDIVTIHANFEGNRYIVRTLCALTNQEEKKLHFPEDVFIANDAVFRSEAGDDLVFYSQSLDVHVFLKKQLLGEIFVQKNQKYQLVAAPTFPTSMQLIYRGILLIENDFFWSKEKMWIRERLIASMKIYEEDAKNRRRGMSSVRSS